MAPHDVCVRGSGAVAHAAALALARRGLRVALHAPARAAARGPDIRAYALGPAAVALLGQLKVWEALPGDARTPVYDMHVEGDSPGAELDFSAWSLGVDALAWIVDAAELDLALQRAADFAPHVERVDAPDAAAALQVHAEGHASAARAQLGVEMPVHDYGQRAIAARLVGAQPHAGVARQWFGAPDVLALLPLDRPEPERSVALVWSLPGARAAELLALPDAAFENAVLDATGGSVGALRLAGARADWPLALARADRVCGPGWVLLGDAAHRIHPLAGQGLNLGLADVVALAEVLAEREPWRGLGELRLLQRYARRRALPTLAMARLTDGLWQLFASRQPLAKELRNRGLNLLNGLPPVKRFLTARALDG